MRNTLQAENNARAEYLDAMAHARATLPTSKQLDVFRSEWKKLKAKLAAIRAAR